MNENPTILKLQKEIERLKKSIKKQRYGLVWMDIPEAFEEDVENKLPILKEVPKLAIKNNDGKPTHILIEGDNYHALTCLNYTHRGKIDVIYIDPPYNTGSDGFRYKDKRIIDKFPDGTEVPTDHPFRHSYWLSFMKKRLELARDLLKNDGVIFISIDDNEVANLNLLCDEIFGEKNFLAKLVWRKKYTGGKHANFFVDMHEYILVYAKERSKLSGFEIDRPEGEKTKFILKDEYVKERGKYYIRPLKSNLGLRPTLIYPIKCPDGSKIKTQWIVSKPTFERLKKENRILFKKKKDGKYQVYMKYYEKDRGGKIKPPSIIDFTSNNEAKLELKRIFNIIEGRDNVLYTVKPTKLIKFFINLAIPEKREGIVLDFFAGSGTTAHVVLALNKEDGGKRKFILCTNNENNICTEVCYPRIKKVIEGYKIKRMKVEGLGNSLKYYKTAFIGENNILNATDEDKVELAHNAGELLAIAENTLELVKQNKYYQLFEDGNKGRYTAVYFREELDKFEEFVGMVEKLKKKATVYVFSWGDEEFNDDFDHMKEIRVKSIPKPILEIYKNIYNLGV